MITVITGTPGAGKTLYAISKLIQPLVGTSVKHTQEDGTVEEVPRTIYTNINNLKIDYVRANVYDWRTCPDGSIIVIDEVQLIEPYKETKQKDNPIVQDLTIHRHRGFDFYFITQSAALLHQ